MKTFGNLQVGDFVYTLTVSRGTGEIIFLAEQVKKIILPHEFGQFFYSTKFYLTKTSLNIDRSLYDRTSISNDRTTICTTPEELINKLRYQMEFLKWGYKCEVKYRRYTYGEQHRIQNKWKEFTQLIRKQLFLNETKKIQIVRLFEYYVKIHIYDLQP